MTRKQKSVKVLESRYLSGSLHFRVAFLAILILASLSRGAQAQADCTTASGQLALMVAKVVVGTPTDVDDTHSSTLGITFASELFKVAQNETSNTSCNAMVSLAVYRSTASASLSGLPNLATNNADFALPAGVTRTAVTKTRSGNTLNCNTTLSRGSLTAGTTVFYRIAKRIDKADGVDPTVVCIRCGDGIQGVPRWNDSGLSATVDSTLVIPESNENNNTVSIP